MKRVRPSMENLHSPKNDNADEKCTSGAFETHFQEKYDRKREHDGSCGKHSQRNAGRGCTGSAENACDKIWKRFRSATVEIGKIVILHTLNATFFISIVSAAIALASGGVNGKAFLAGYGAGYLGEALWDGVPVLLGSVYRPGASPHSVREILQRERQNVLLWRGLCLVGSLVFLMAISEGSIRATIYGESSNWTLVLLFIATGILSAAADFSRQHPTEHNKEIRT